MTAQGELQHHDRGRWRSLTALAALLPSIVHALSPPPVPYPNRSYGFIDRAGTVIVPAACDNATMPDADGWVSLSRDGKQGFYNLRTGAGTGMVYDDVREREVPLFMAALAPVRRGKLFGYVDHAGRLAIPFRYQDAAPFEEGLARIKLGGRYGFIDRTGRIVIQPIYDGVSRFTRFGLASASLENRSVIIDRHGRTIVGPRYDQIIVPASEDFVLVRSGALWGALDRHGRVLFEPRFKGLHWFERNGLAGASLDDDGWSAQKIGYWGLVDRSGTFVVPPSYQRVGEFDASEANNGPTAPPGLVAVTNRDAAGVETMRFIDRTGRVVWSPPAGISVHQVYRSGLFGVFRDRPLGGPSFGLFDPRKPEQGPAWFDVTGREGAFGLIPVEVDHMWGYADKSMRLAIGPTFLSAEPFGTDGLAVVSTDRGRAGFIDRQAKIVLATNYDEASPFNGVGVSRVAFRLPTSNRPDADQCRIIRTLSKSIRG